MIIEEGKFLLYSHITPALKAGDYRFEVSQAMTAKKGTQNIDAGAVPVEPLQTHVTVTAPRYQLPPDQVLSTYPPAGTEGAYGSRLPQIVIKRRTLPWERGLRIPDGHGGETAVAETTPWLALVLIAEGEAELKLNQDVGKCVSSDVHLDGEQDVAKGNCLVVRQSILEKILPSRKDVPLLAHARQVDIHDTELMMGDDDGFLSVVISNRLPVAGVDAEGDPTPVKYLACLINLEGQFHRLIPEAPAPRDHIQLFNDRHALVVQPAVYDHVVSGGLEANWNTTGLATSGQVHVAAPHGDALADDAPLADGPHAAGPTRRNGDRTQPGRVRRPHHAGLHRQDGLGPGIEVRHLRNHGRRLPPGDRDEPRSAVHVPVPAALELRVDGVDHVRDADARTRLGSGGEPAAGPSAAGDAQASPTDGAGAVGSGRDRTRRAGPADAPRRQHPQLVPRAVARAPEQRGTAADRPCLRPAPCRHPGRSRGHLAGRRVRGRPAARTQQAGDGCRADEVAAGAVPGGPVGLHCGKTSSIGCRSNSTGPTSARCWRASSDRSSRPIPNSSSVPTARS